MDVRQLEAFLAVAEELHFGRAAERLFMAQSPLSRTITRLEIELGARLFERSTRTVSLTPSGEALIEPARATLEAVRRAQVVVQSVQSGEAGVVRIEFSGVAAHPIVASAAREMRADHPGIRLDLSAQATSHAMMPRLAAEEIDVAFGRWDHTPPGISTRVMAEDSLVAVLPRAHRLSGSESISFPRIAGEPFVSLPHIDGSVTTDRLWRLGYQHGVAINIVQFAPDTASCLALVRAGMGCHLTLRSVADTVVNPDICFIPLDPESIESLPDVHLRVAWRADEASEAVEITLKAILKRARRDG